MMSLLAKIAGKVDQMENRIQVLNAKVDFGSNNGQTLVGGTGEDPRGSHGEISSSHN